MFGVVEKKENRRRRHRHKTRQVTFDAYLRRQNELYFLAVFSLVGLFESWAVKYLNEMGLTKADTQEWVEDIAREVALLLSERLLRKAKPIRTVEEAKKVVKAFTKKAKYQRALVMDAANRLGIIKRYRDEDGNRKRAVALYASLSSYKEDRDPALTCCCY